MLFVHILITNNNLLRLVDGFIAGMYYHDEIDYKYLLGTQSLMFSLLDFCIIIFIISLIRIYNQLKFALFTILCRVHNSPCSSTLVLGNFYHADLQTLAGFNNSLCGDISYIGKILPREFFNSASFNFYKSD